MVRPLTKKRKKDGVLYTRPLGIQKEIEAALAVNDQSTLIEKAKNPPGSSEFMTSECLVHLIREHYHRKNDRIANPLLIQLMVRCKANLQKTVPNNRMSEAETVREDILGKFGVMFGEDAGGEPGSRLDFFEIKFNSAFRALRVDTIRVEKNHKKELMAISEVSDEEEPLNHEERLAQLSNMARTEATQDADVLFKEMVKLAKDLPEDMRRAFILCNLMGCTQQEAATKCGVPVRTIYNRLKAAEQKIKKTLGE